MNQGNARPFFFIRSAFLLSLIFSGCAKTINLSDDTSPLAEQTASCTAPLQAKLAQIPPGSVAPGSDVIFKITLTTACPERTYVVDGLIESPFAMDEIVTFTKSYPQAGTYEESVTVREVTTDRTARTNTLVVTVAEGGGEAAPIAVEPIEIPPSFPLPPPPPTVISRCFMSQLNPASPGNPVDFLMLIQGPFNSVKFNDQAVVPLPLGGGSSYLVARVAPNASGQYVALGEVSQNNGVALCGQIVHTPRCEIQVTAADWNGVELSVENTGVVPVRVAELDGEVQSEITLLEPGQSADYDFLPDAAGDRMASAKIFDIDGNEGRCQVSYHVEPGLIPVSQSVKRVYWYLSAGIDLLAVEGPQALATGYGTSGWGMWAVIGGQSSVRVIQDSNYRVTRDCAANEVVIGVTDYGQLRCSELHPDFALANVSNHVGTWGTVVENRCPANKVMVKWAFPAANYTVQYRCAEIHHVQRSQ